MVFFSRPLRIIAKKGGCAVWKGLSFNKLPKYCRYATAASEQATSNELKLTVASPLKAFYANVAVKQVDVPGMSSSVGILPVHVPTIAVLKPGIVKVYELDGNVSKFFVSSGTLSMNIDGSCQVLAEELCSLDELDEEAIKNLIDISQKKASDLNSSDVEKAEAGISIEVAEAALKAITEK